MPGRTRRHERLAIAALVSVACWAHRTAMADGPGARQPHVKARLIADRTSVAPGATLRLGVEFDIDADWHIYWITAGDPGAPAMPTTIKLTAPAGFEVRGPRFPAPQRHGTVEGDTYILEGRPVILFDAKAPSGLTSATNAFEVEADWLVCKKSCIPGSARLKLELPVRTTGGDVSSPEAGLLSDAAALLPIPAANAAYVRLAGTLSQDRVRPGDAFEVRLAVDVKAGHHIQSHQPGVDSLIATDVFLEPVDGLEIESVGFPAGTERQFPGLGKVREYSGRVVISAKARAGDKLDGASATLRGVLRYQACTDKGTCFPPEEIAFEVAVPFAKAGDAVKQVGALVGTADVAHAASDDAGEPSADAGSADVPPAAVGRDGRAAQGPTSASGGVVEAISRIQNWFQRFGLAGYLLLAAMGGFLLNFMPCVLPVISLKVLSFVKQAQEDRLRIFALGLTFSTGIVASFLVLAALVLAANQSWGSLFQYPQVVIGLAAIVTAFALSLFGVFSLTPPRVVDSLGEKVSGEGLGSAFGMGVLATLLGTACTAPFLTAVIAFAVKRSAAEGVLIFAAAGLGMALPYLLLTAVPGWLRFVPRAGPWMKTFEQIMGFLLLGTAIWLLYPLPGQITGKGVIWALVFILAAAFAAWLYGRVEYGAPNGKRLCYYGLALGTVAFGWLLPFRWVNTIPQLQAEAERLRLGQYAAHDDSTWERDIPWRPYSKPRVLELVRAGHTVFVDFTADWCASCKTNEATSINIASTRELMRQLNVVPFKADFTNQNAEIKAELAALGKSGVPAYVVYSPGQPEHPATLPELLTPGIVAEALRAAGAGKPHDAAAPAASVRGGDDREGAVRVAQP